jgi:hypothetical protein
MRRRTGIIEQAWIAVLVSWLTLLAAIGKIVRWRSGAPSAAGLVLAATLYLATGAAAYFTTSGAGTVAASETTLAAPTGVSSSVSGPSVNVGWSGVTPPGGGAVAGYYVERFAGASSTPACGSSPTSLLPAASTSCTDTGDPSGNGVPAGSYTYEAVAVWRSWSTASSAGSPVTVQPPTITSAAPASADQGAPSLNVTIAGTNFVSGATPAFVGTGITVNSTTYVSATRLTANITIATSATTGSRNVTVTNPDGDVATGTNAFTVNAAPTATSLSPSARGQGAANQTITISGTNFDAGAALSASFSGTGITVNSTTYVSATQLTANISLAGTAATGLRTLTVTNGDGSTATATNAFTVDAGPAMTGGGPTSADQGATNLSLTITGTNFGSGATVSFSGTGITVNSTTYVSATQLTANITISTSASTGSRSVTVTNSDAGTETIPGAFTVNSAPTVTSTSPSAADQGATSYNVTISGTGFDSGTQLATSFSGTGITVNSTTYVSATQLTANVTIAVAAATGARNVLITNGDGSTAAATALFTVNAAPTVTSATPASADQGATSDNITINGTAFISGAAASFSGTGITVNSTTYVSATQLTANVTIAVAATTGARNITTANGDGSSATKTSAFTINAAPTVSSVSPTTRGQGATNQTLTITGTNFDAGLALSTAFSGTGITVNSTVYVSATQLTANVTIAPTATTGARNITITNGDGSTASKASALTVDAAPTVTSLNPTSADQGATSDNITINGTGFVSGATASFSGTGITVNSTTYVSATQLTANVTISPTATTGTGNVTVTNPDAGTVTSTGTFTVNAAPTVTSVSPSSDARNATYTVTINGTGFDSGTHLAASFSGTGITVNSTTYTSSTALSVNITISNSATISNRTVTVTNGDGSTASKANAFFVT